MSRTHTHVGRWGEDLAATVLEQHGFSIIQRNWRPEPVEGVETFKGEVDIVALDAEMNLVFVEVKTRTTDSFGHPFEAITADKAKRLRFLAYSWCANKDATDFISMRIDAVAITGTPEKFTFEHLQAVA